MRGVNTSTFRKLPVMFQPIVKFNSRGVVRLFSGQVDMTSKVLASVQEFINVRKAEFEQYEAVDPADKEETKALIEKLDSVRPDLNTTWASLGFDGLDEVEVVLAIESSLGVTLSDDEFHSIHSVSDAVKVLGKYAPKQG